MASAYVYIYVINVVYENQIALTTIYFLTVYRKLYTDC